MSINKGAELMSGLSDVPLFAVCLVMIFSTAAYRKKGALGRGWFLMTVTLAITLLAGILLHIIHLPESLLRILWPLEYALIGTVTAVFWIQVLRIFKPETAEKGRVLITALAAAVSVVNGVVRFLFGCDLNPGFCFLSVPAVLHIGYSAISCRGRKDIRTRFIWITVFLILAVATESFIQTPVVLFGLPCGGAVFSHLFIILAMLMLAGIMRVSTEGSGQDE
ncbi:MAG: hypothetical protein J5744_08670 [Oscillospiraceae bacterium]|nr:hypothetical protein [Oscillospiraceae bacterium]